ncbi:MAG: L-histidine N(alpha)-methyltransferase [Bacteroidetes bacterium]|jgi:dimethylhistidine N-methyltransferase|nr:L-histidine N(alpha)-methyltransferase [Bacteroidota bacterium]
MPSTQSSSSAAPTADAFPSDFAQDVLEGLTQSPKKLPSKYFYDERGDKLFQDIMHMPSYYLMNCEHDIFEAHKAAILEAIGYDAFQLLELGAGDGYKTKVLLEHFLEAKAAFQYQPIDISPNVLEELEQSLHKLWPQLDVQPLAGDYFEMLHRVSEETAVPKVVLCLGANIGNYPVERAQRFLNAISAELNSGDKLLIGFDLKKDPQVILDAYDDPEGITAVFNLNLLRRINRELDANFDLQAFRHWETYNPVTGATKSYIVSKAEQHVFIKALNRSFHFAAWEAMDVELSQKYSLEEVEGLAEATGFEVEQHFTDQKAYFVDSLWRVK